MKRNAHTSINTQQKKTESDKGYKCDVHMCNI